MLEGLGSVSGLYKWTSSGLVVGLFLSVEGNHRTGGGSRSLFQDFPNLVTSLTLLSTLL